MEDFGLVGVREATGSAFKMRSEANRLTVCLITALALEDYIDPELTARGANQFLSGNIGVLTLASVLRQRGYDPKVVNLDLLFLDFLKRNGDQISGEVKTQVLETAGLDSGSAADSKPERSLCFLDFVIEHLKLQSFDIFGFSSISSSYPLTLRLAKEVKGLNPNSRIILGGPQASVVDVPTMQAFPFIDLVLRGEADETFPILLEFLSCGETNGKLEALAGVTYREGDLVVRNPNAPVVADLDRVPLPAFDLDPDLKNRGSVYLELGRGCPFVCTFCSTNDFFRRNFRLKSCHKMIEEMCAIKEEYGLSNFSLIHDMYTVDRKKVMAFCESLLACGQEFTWGCSARTDCINDELIGLMARAGCRGIFFGIETGSERLQRVIKKNLDLDAAWKRIQCADQYGIKTAVALITAFPDETRDDLRDTIHFFVDTLRLDHAEPQLSLLAPLAGTPIHEEYRDRLVLDHIFSDMSYQGWQHDPADVEMITSYPDVFPNFYAAPTSWLPRSYFKEIRDFVMYVTTWFRWLPVALLQDSGDLLKVFDRWRAWLQEIGVGDSEKNSGPVPYYCQRQFRDDFLEFVRTCYIPEMATARGAIAALLQAEGDVFGTRRISVGRVEGTEMLDAASFPFQLGNLATVDLAVDYTELVERLRTKGELCSVPERDTTIALRPNVQKKTEVWQLAPSSTALMRLCDGKHTVEEIVRAFSLLDDGLDGVPAEKVCLYGLMHLREEGFIGVSCSPVELEEISCVTEDNTTSIVRYSPPPQSSNTQQPWPWSPPSAAENPHASSRAQAKHLPEAQAQDVYTRATQHISHAFPGQSVAFPGVLKAQVFAQGEVFHVEAWKEPYDSLGLFRFIRVGSLFFIDEEMLPYASPSLSAENCLVIPQMRHSMLGHFDGIKYYTATCLRALEALSWPREICLVDSGSGDGMLSLAALRWGVRKAVLIDCQRRYLEYAGTYLARNGYAQGTDFYLIEGDLSKPQEVLSRLPELGSNVIFFSTIGDFSAYKFASNRSSLNLIPLLESACETRILTLLLGGYNSSRENRPDRDLILAQQLGFETPVIETKLASGSPYFVLSDPHYEAFILHRRQN